jgi:hypothetical protein
MSPPGVIRRFGNAFFLRSVSLGSYMVNGGFHSVMKTMKGAIIELLLQRNLARVMSQYLFPDASRLTEPVLNPHFCLF